MSAAPKGKAGKKDAPVRASGKSLLVVEASLGSGSLHTARAAARFGRIVLACPGTAGTDALIHGGAAIAEDAGDVLDALAGRPRELEVRPPEGEAAALWAALDDAHPLTIERLSEKAGLPLRVAIRALATLELDGLALAAPGGSYVRALRGGRV